MRCRHWTRRGRPAILGRVASLSLVGLVVCGLVFVAGLVLGTAWASRRWPRMVKLATTLQLGALLAAYLVVRPGSGSEDVQAAIEDARKQGVPVFLAFHANSCPPCHVAKPAVDALEWQLGDRLEVVRVDAMAERNAGVTRAFNIRGWPTFILLDAQGAVAYRQFGGRPDMAEIEALLP